jgi:hypothetical protein
VSARGLLLAVVGTAFLVFALPHVLAVFGVAPIL